MLESILTLRSSIHPSLIRDAVIRGSCLAGAGGLLLFLGGIFLPTLLLNMWGFPIFLGGIALVTWGLWPYRRLKNLENDPYRIIIDDKHVLYMTWKGKMRVKVPLEAITKIEYIEQDNTHPYGIKIYFKNKLHKETQTTSLILPYFSKYAFEELAEVYEAI